MSDRHFWSQARSRARATIRAAIGPGLTRMVEATPAHRALADRVEWLEGEVSRMGPHIAANTQAIDRLPSRLVVDEGTTLEMAAQEHRRARERLQLVSQYEERINRLERLMSEQGRLT